MTTHDPRCPSCGHVNEPDATHCAQCNFPLRETGGEPEAAPRDGRDKPVQEVRIESVAIEQAD